jgi:hypothetical protein
MSVLMVCNTFLTHGLLTACILCIGVCEPALQNSAEANWLIAMSLGSFKMTHLSESWQTPTGLTRNGVVRKWPNWLLEGVSWSSDYSKRRLNRTLSPSRSSENRCIWWSRKGCRVIICRNYEGNSTCPREGEYHSQY